MAKKKQNRNWFKRKAVEIALAAATLLPTRAMTQNNLPVPPADGAGAGTTQPTTYQPKHASEYALFSARLPFSNQFTDHISLDAVTFPLTISRQPDDHNLGGGNLPLRFTWKDTNKLKIDQEHGKIYYNNNLVLSYAAGSHIYGAAEHELKHGWTDLPISRAARSVSAFLSKDIPITFGVPLEGQLSALPENFSSAYRTQRSESVGADGSYEKMRQDFNNRVVAEYKLRTFKPAGATNYDTNYNEFIWTIAHRESGGWNPYAKGGSYGGLFQFAMKDTDRNALEEVGLTKNERYLGIAGIHSDEDFLKNIDVQVTAGWNLAARNAHRYIKSEWVGKTLTARCKDGIIRSVDMTLPRLIAALHLGGPTNVQATFNSTDPENVWRDGNGMSIVDYCYDFNPEKIAEADNLAAYPGYVSSPITITYHSDKGKIGGTFVSGGGRAPDSPSDGDREHDDIPGGGGIGGLGGLAMKAIGSVGGKVLLGAATVGTMLYLANKETAEERGEMTAENRDAPTSTQRDTLPIQRPAQEETTDTTFTSRNAAYFTAQDQPTSYRERVTKEKTETAQAKLPQHEGTKWFSAKNIALVAATAGAAILTWQAVTGRGWTGRMLRGNSGNSPGL